MFSLRSPTRGPEAPAGRISYAPGSARAAGDGSCDGGATWASLIISRNASPTKCPTKHPDPCGRLIDNNARGKIAIPATARWSGFPAGATITTFNFQRPTVRGEQGKHPGINMGKATRTAQAASMCGCVGVARDKERGVWQVMVKRYTLIEVDESTPPRSAPRTRSRPVTQASQDGRTRDARGPYHHARAGPGSYLEDAGLLLEFSPCCGVADVRPEGDHGIQREPAAGISQECRLEQRLDHVLRRDICPV